MYGGIGGGPHGSKIFGRGILDGSRVKSRLVALTHAAQVELDGVLLRCGHGWQNTLRDCDDRRRRSGSRPNRARRKWSTSCTPAGARIGIIASTKANSDWWAVVEDFGGRVVAHQRQHSRRGATSRRDWRGGTRHPAIDAWTLAVPKAEYAVEAGSCRKKFRDLKAAFHSRERFVVLFGPSGAGKTLTLQLIAGLLTPDAGTIVLGKRVIFDSKSEINLAPQHRNIGYLFQDYALFPHLTVFENIGFGLRRGGRCPVG